jgi:hypothetical protein
MTNEFYYKIHKVIFIKWEAHHRTKSLTLLNSFDFYLYILFHPTVLSICCFNLFIHFVYCFSVYIILYIYCILSFVCFDITLLFIYLFDCLFLYCTTLSVNIRVFITLCVFWSLFVQWMYAWQQGWYNVGYIYCIVYFCEVIFAT